MLLVDQVACFEAFPIDAVCVIIGPGGTGDVVSWESLSSTVSYDNDEQSVVSMALESDLEYRI